MALPDNRIRFPAPRIDFTADVGDTGQDHDSYPAAGGQARYDWMRMFLVGLLSQQASYDEPTQYRQGTPWFDLNTSTLKIRLGDAWVPLSQAITLTEPDTAGNVVSLANWYTTVQDLLAGLAPEVVFSGICNANNITTVAIPESLQSNLVADSRVFMYINGLLIKPTNVALIGSPLTTVRLSGVSLSSGDAFTIIIRRVPAASFYGTNVVVP